jgi:uncharacterized protein
MWDLTHAGLPVPLVWWVYEPWTLRDEFDNRYAIMSDVDHFSYATEPGVAKPQTPALIVFSFKVF